MLGQCCPSANNNVSGLLYDANGDAGLRAGGLRAEGLPAEAVKHE